MDSFAGSGSTGHAVMQLNATDGGNRNFVLVELDETIAKDITAKRLSLAQTGYQRNLDNGTTENVAGLGGGFCYCTLGKPLFDEWGSVTDGVTFADLAAYIFFSETGSPIPTKASGKSTLLGSFQDRAVHLLWSPDSAGVANTKAGNVLTAEILASLQKAAPDFTGVIVIYGEGCTVTADRLAAAGVTFKQIPYQVIGA